VRHRGGVAQAAALVLLALLAARASRAAAVEDPACGVMRLARRSGALTLRLPHTFIRPGTDSVWTRAGALVPGRDYLIDRLHGELRLLRDDASVDTLWVRACWLLDPPPFERQIETYRPPAPAEAESVKASPPPVTARPGLGRDPTVVPAGATLAVTGNKTIAVDFGSSQDAALRQSLDLAISGSLAPGVTLTGVLSDRNTPLTAEGGTQELQALDRVLIELHAPQANASFGDIGVTYRDGEFGRIERRLQGARGEWTRGGFTTSAAAASVGGEYNRLQFIGVDGRQGPYALTDRDGNTGVSVVAGSDVVTLDGARLSRGEAADYSIDYDRAQITFTNRRPISGSSRITVDYQFTLQRYRRNLAAFESRWSAGRAHGFTRLLTEGDDRGSPLDVSIDATDRSILAAAGDSAGRALAPGVTPGVGDYDTVRVAGAVRFAFAGPDSGAFDVRFARVGPGLGDYSDSVSVSGRTAFRWVGEGNGAFRVGVALPLPETHQLATFGGALDAGPARVDFEVAGSRRDLNTFSSLDDGDNAGGALRAGVSVGGGVGGWVPGAATLEMQVRSVGTRFAPFDRLERPFSQETWGLSPSEDIDRQDRAELIAGFRPKAGGDLRAVVGGLRLPTGFESFRRALDWTRDGTIGTRLSLERADGRDPGRRYEDGGRERGAAELRVRLPWIEPAVRYESDERRVPSDSALSGQRFREVGVELLGSRRYPWKTMVGWGQRRDATLDSTGFTDQTQVGIARAGLESPSGPRLGVTLAYQRRNVEPLAGGVRTRSDLASARFRMDEREGGPGGSAGTEVTSEAQSQRTRSVVYVGPGQGAYDQYGNFVGTGDYTLVTGVSGALERISRAATSARFGWTFGRSEAMRGSRLGFDFESDARRRGDLRASDLAVPPAIVLGDVELASGSVLQRHEGEVAPGSPATAFRARAERRVTADRSYTDFAQTLDERVGTLRWRARAASGWSGEAEGRLRTREATQQQGAAPAYHQRLLERGVVGQLVFSPDARLRVAAVGDLAWNRPASSEDVTRTLRLGPDLGWGFGTRGRLDATARRAFVSGPPETALLPTADPAGAPRWEFTARADVRVREIVTLGMSLLSRQFEGRASRTTGRLEVRAFF
jgi:hypothetical protein